MGPVAEDRAYHHGNLRGELLTEAERVLVSDGVEALSLRALARTLGVSHAAPARHFRDRQALLDALALEGFSRLNTELRAAATGTDALPHQFTALVRSYVAFATTHSPLLSLMYAHKRDESASDELRAAGHASLGLVTDLVIDGQRTGLLRRGDPERLALLAFSMVHGLATLAASDLLDDAPLDEMVDLTADGVWRALRA